MSSAQATPRKRKMGEVAVTPTTTRGSKIRGAPSPNPPIAPFPTPRSRHRVKAEPVFIDEAPLAKSASIPQSSGHHKPLPPHLQLLLTLHHAFNLALSLHIATHPPVLPPHSPSTTSLQLPALTNFLAIKDAVERTSGRRFGTAELGRLAWVWAWDGQDAEEKGVVVQSAKEQMKEEADDNPFLVASSSGPLADSISTSNKEVSGLTYLLTPTRTLDPAGRKVHTYGIGVELDLKPGETRQVLANGNEGGLGYRGQGGGTGAIGRWSAGGEAREQVFRQRLEKWVEIHGGWEPPADIETVHGLPTPAASRDSGRSTIPPIPLLPLPPLPASSGLLPAAVLFSSPGATTSSPRKLPRPAATAVHGLSDPFELEGDETPKKGKVKRPGSVEDRRQAMMDRIKARSSTGNGHALATLGSSITPGARRVLMSASETQEELKRRSTLSRLEGVAEGVWMLFSGPSLGASSLPTPPRGRRKAIPMDEAAEVVLKSSKTPISLAEAHASLKMLCDLCPWFLTWKVIAKKEWLEMPPQVAMGAFPPSPGSGLAVRGQPRRGEAEEEDDGEDDKDDGTRGTIAPRPPVSPSAKGRPRVFGREGSPSPAARLTPNRSPGGLQLVGAASPGRVRRIGGLREVRERIRKELEA